MSSFLDALANKNEGPPPVWLMRQAGRYMKSYQKLRETHSFARLALTPELAAEVTLLPLRKFDLDAAILFSDILFPLSIFGATVEFPETSGPKILKPFSLSFPGDIRAYLEESLSPIYQAISLLKLELDKPLIGFAGAPWTLFCYLVSGGKPDPQKALYLTQTPDFERIFSYLEDLVTMHLTLQIEAGCDAIQIFDSFSHVAPDLQKLSLKPLERILQKISCPSIFYKTGIKSLPFFETFLPCALSLDETVSPEVARHTLSHPYTLQGNLNPLLLAGEKEPLTEALKKLLLPMKNDPGFILNVSSGLLPSTKEENVQLIVDIVREIL